MKTDTLWRVEEHLDPLQFARRAAEDAVVVALFVQASSGTEPTSQTLSVR